MVGGQSDGVPAPQKMLFPGNKLTLKWERVYRVGAGLHNLGNTCFLNSTVQCLTYTPPLANYLLSKEHSRTCEYSGGPPQGLYLNISNPHKVLIHGWNPSCGCWVCTRAAERHSRIYVEAAGGEMQKQLLGFSSCSDSETRLRSPEHKYKGSRIIQIVVIFLKKERIENKIIFRFLFYFSPSLGGAGNTW